MMRPMNTSLRLLGRIRRSLVGRLPTEVEDIKILLGQSLALQHTSRSGNHSLADYEFKVFSQFGEDGIIQCLLSRLPDLPPSFIEFGVEDYSESNTRFLLQSRNWRGLVIDSDQSSVRAIQTSDLYWKHNITALHAFITRENINDLLVDSGFVGQIGILSIDIDGNDYWVWDAITVAKPAIVVIEYNGLWGGDRRVTVPYRKDFDRSVAHYSMLYFGASLAALESLGRSKGYVLIGCNSHGTNAFFVRTDLAESFEDLADPDPFIELQVRQSRDLSGKLTYLSPNEAARVVSHLSLLDLDYDMSLLVGDLLADE